MKRIAGIILVFLLLTQLGLSQDWAQQKVNNTRRHREWITVKHDGRTVDAVVFYPEESHNTPVVLIVHEIFGMTDWVEDLADQIAEAGYISVAPDLLSGMGPGGGRSSSFAPGATTEAVSKLPPDQITADLNAVADYALKFPSSNGKLMVTGFCWGGGQSFRFATNRPDLKAAFVFYGVPPEKGDMSRIKAPMYGFYGGNDARVNATIPGSREQMKASGKTYEPIIYDAAGHGFMRGGEDPKGTDGDRKARDEAWKRWKELLEKSSK